MTTRTRKALTTSALAALALAGSALPALAHASIPSSVAFGLAPNTEGGTGLAGVAPPYLYGSTNVITVRAPFEQTVAFDGRDDTTVDLKAIVPAGWTNPVCGAALTQVNTPATGSTNQPGTTVAGWTCAVETAGGHQVLHWTGPQVAVGTTAAGSAQFFRFTVTVPKPAVQTTYNGAAGSGTEGFIVDQTYASGEGKHWIPSADYPGTLPAGLTSSVASGLVRTVAGPTTLVGTSVELTTTAALRAPAKGTLNGVVRRATGQPVIGESVGIYYRPLGSSAEPTLARTLVTGTDGRFSTPTVQTHHTEWIVRFAGVTSFAPSSASATTYVQLSSATVAGPTTVKAGAKATFAGTILPGGPGTKVKLQWLRDNGTVADLTGANPVSAAGSYVLPRVFPGKGTFRLRVLGLESAGNHGSASRVFTLKVV